MRAFCRLRARACLEVCELLLKSSEFCADYCCGCCYIQRFAGLRICRVGWNEQFLVRAKQALHLCRDAGGFVAKQHQRALGQLLPVDVLSVKKCAKDGQLCGAGF